MRKLVYLLGFSMLATLTSCTDDDIGTTLADVDIDSEASMASTFEDVDNIAEAGMSEGFASGRVERDFLLDCATVTKDSVNKIITIDYGDEGCEGPHGRIRRGKIIITHDGRRFIPGAFRTITFDGFSVDSVEVEGTRMVENISVSMEDTPTFRITLVGGQLTFPDGTKATREAEWIRTWVRANNPLEDLVTVSGSASGVSREEIEYAAVIDDEDILVYKRGCQATRIRIAVQGTKTFTYGDREVIVDFGDGTCDNIVTITRDGETFEREINTRRRHRN